tara:strand:+ start:2347 stop:3144 length:798 start_codon:yes stop_codon:yes gene_type:complete
MRDITKNKERYCRYYAERCEHLQGKDNIVLCPLKGRCTCRLAAEIQAYLHTILPQGYQQFTIFNFDGRRGKEELLEAKQVIKIKEQISNYCWGLPYSRLKDLSARNTLDADKSSVMDKRRARGDCVVIHGDASKQSGRTLIASIILREAIRRRFASNANALQTYEWVEFESLKAYARAGQLTNYQYADWLVVDNFSQIDTDAPRHIKNYIASVIDPFFITRAEENLPTILVFRFNIKSVASMQQFFGVGVERMINRTGTIEVLLA